MRDLIIAGRQREKRRPARVDPRLRIMEIKNDGYRCRYKHLHIIISEGLEEDGRWWTHGSVSRSDRSLPTYEDLRMLKSLVFGSKRTAIQVFPPDDRHIDWSGRLPTPVQVLHLWGVEHEDLLPDFAAGGNQI